MDWEERIILALTALEAFMYLLGIIVIGLLFLVGIKYLSEMLLWGLP